MYIDVLAFRQPSLKRSFAEQSEGDQNTLNGLLVSINAPMPTSSKQWWATFIIHTTPKTSPCTQIILASHSLLVLPHQSQHPRKKQHSVLNSRKLNTVYRDVHFLTLWNYDNSIVISSVCFVSYRSTLQQTLNMHSLCWHYNRHVAMIPTLICMSWSVYDTWATMFQNLNKLLLVFPKYGGHCRIDN